MSKQTFSSNPSLPFSDAVVANGTVYVSGQVGLGSDGKVVDGGIEAQVRASLENLKKALEGAGSSMDKVVRTCCYVVNQADVAAFNKVYAEYFTDDKPARSTIITKLVNDAFLFEIDAVAVQS